MKSTARGIKKLKIFLERVCAVYILILGIILGARDGLALAQGPPQLPPWKYDAAQKVKLSFRA
jgi:hypothetical protein